MNLPADAPYLGIRVTVLGAGGFIGRWVSRLLSAQGAELQLVVRDAGRFEGIRSAWAIAGSVVTADLRSAPVLRDLVGATRPAIVFNLAGYGVDPSERAADSAERLNADLPPAVAAVMAECADHAWSGQHVVHAGSALEYGTAAGDLHERTVGTPTTLYGSTKLEGTTRLHEAADRLGVRATTGRLFTVYGPGEHDGRLLPSLLTAARTDGPIPLTAGLQHRDFTYAADAAEGLLRLGALPAPSTGIVNVATGRLTAVRRFAETAAEVLGIDAARLAFGAVATRAEEMRHDPVSIVRLRTLTQWSPRASISDGIARTVAFRREAPPPA